MDVLTRELQWQTDQLRIGRILIQYGRYMGKLQSVGERIKQVRAEQEAEADKLMSKLDAIEKAAPPAFARGHNILDAHKADLDDLEADLRSISNIDPLDGSAL